MSCYTVSYTYHCTDVNILFMLVGMQHLDAGRLQAPLGRWRVIEINSHITGVNCNNK